ncbi:MAG TPA: hypothetical protein VE973_02245 [Candidatus Limnocylindria bacterium]|nr:hypothetical protein [Candidatus Limnocylindria bacterium]
MNSERARGKIERVNPDETLTVSAQKEGSRMKRMLPVPFECIDGHTPGKNLAELTEYGSNGVIAGISVEFIWNEDGKAVEKVFPVNQ